MKTCFKCNIQKPYSDFYKHKGMSDGFLGKCKACTKKDSKQRRDYLTENDPIWFEKEAERQREKEKTRYFLKLKGDSEYHKNHNKAIKKYSKKYPYKRQATKAANYLDCPKGYERHHWSYNKEHWTDVIFLTKESHYYIHRFLKFSEDTGYYLTAEDLLLDTKEKHIAYITSLI